jgi:hypothetical protein
MIDGARHACDLKPVVPQAKSAAQRERDTPRFGDAPVLFIWMNSSLNVPSYPVVQGSQICQAYQLRTVPNLQPNRLIETGVQS